MSIDSYYILICRISEFASDLSNIGNGQCDLLKLTLTHVNVNVFLSDCEMTSYHFKSCEQNQFISRNH